MPPADTAAPSRAPTGLPASRDGIGASSVGLPPGDPRAVLDFLIARFPHVEASEWQERLEAGAVWDETGRLVAAGDACRLYRKLHYFRSLPGEPALPEAEALIYRDEQIAVFDKPHGMAVVPAGRHLHQTLLARVRRRPGFEEATPVHRLDRDTAGLVLFCLQPASRDAYHALFRRRQVDKRYTAVAGVAPGLRFPLLHRSRIRESPASFMQMAEVPGEPDTETRIELDSILDDAGRQGRYELRPTTGARHQLRLHMASLGLPIANDRIYPVLQPDAAGRPEALERERREPLQLLARHLAFTDPLTGEAHAFDSRRRLQLAGAA